MWDAPLKDEKGIVTITEAFEEFLDEFKHKLNKTWLDKGSGF